MVPLLMSLALLAHATAGSPIAVGAIRFCLGLHDVPGSLTPVPLLFFLAVGRWDAWFGAPVDANFGLVGRYVTADLGPAKWHYRVPMFGRVLNDSAVDVNGNSSSAMSQELSSVHQ